MADYSLDLECGCVNWCRCEQLKARQQAKEAGFDTIGLRVAQEVYVCNICEAITLDYSKHKGWHMAMVSLV